MMLYNVESRPVRRLPSRRMLAWLGMAVIALFLFEASLELQWLDAISPQAMGQAAGSLLHGLTHIDAARLLGAYGYWAVLCIVALESTGLPVPGETMLLAAAVYAGTAHAAAPLNIAIVIAAAATGAILGDNLGYLIGRAGGYRLLRRYGKYVFLTERKLRLGQYLFDKHGGKVVFFGHFLPVLRICAAFLAGTARLPWKRFLAYNAAGGLLWAAGVGLGGYLIGQSIHRVGGYLGIATIVLAVVAGIGSMLFLRRNEHRLQEEADRAFPPSHE
jgi:membrane protein DedA with SNARE-associated domain